MITAITGVSGHCGANLARALIEEGRTVRALVRADRRAIEGLDLEPVVGDLADRDSLMELCAGAETVFHCAAHISIVTSDSDLTEQTNLAGTRNLIEACRRQGVKRLVHFSSVQAYACGDGHDPVDEELPVCHDEHRHPYDRTKAQAQSEVQRAAENGLDAVIVNPTTVLGPHDYKPSRMGATLMDLYLNRMPGLPDGGSNWVDVRDVAAGAIAAERRGRRGHSYLLGGQWRHIRDLSMMLGEIAGVRTPRLVMPLWLCMLSAYGAVAWAGVTGTKPRFTPYAIKTIQLHQNISHGKAERELGYRPRPLEDTLRDTIAWLKESGTLERYAQS